MRALVNSQSSSTSIWSKSKHWALQIIATSRQGDWLVYLACRWADKTEAPNWERGEALGANCAGNFSEQNILSEMIPPTIGTLIPLVTRVNYGHAR